MVEVVSSIASGASGHGLMDSRQWTLDSGKLEPVDRAMSCCGAHLDTLEGERGSQVPPGTVTGQQHPGWRGQGGGRAGRRVVLSKYVAVT